MSVVAFRADGRRHRINADPSRDVWLIREWDRPTRSLLAELAAVPMPQVGREVALRRQELRVPSDFCGPLEDLGFGWTIGHLYRRRVVDYRTAMSVAWNLEPCQFQVVILVGLLLRAEVDKLAFGPLCWRDAVVFVEEGSKFYEIFGGP